MWKDLAQDTIYQIMSACSINTQDVTPIFYLSKELIDFAIALKGMWYVEERITAKPKEKN